MIAVDWGTSSLRCYRLDARGEIVESRSSGDGILNVAAGQFPRVLEKQIAGWKETPIVMSGMVGSRQGWKEAPYVKCPAGFDEIAAQLVEVRQGTWIVPGLSCRAIRLRLWRNADSAWLEYSRRCIYCERTWKRLDENI